jgi:hypothetical protein
LNKDIDEYLKSPIESNEHRTHIVDPKFTTLFRDTFGMNEKEFEMLLSYFELKKYQKKEFYLKPGKVCKHKAYVTKVVCVIM